MSAQGRLLPFSGRNLAQVARQSAIGQERAIEVSPTNDKWIQIAVIPPYVVLDPLDDGKQPGAGLCGSRYPPCWRHRTNA
ncbi:MAG: hypothetical protein GY938_04955 [Ketobacter sp.]|nr:hypothetical protein [Ketobacter sp.]